MPRPLIWIERYLTFEGDPFKFALVDFAFWRPRPAGLGTDGRVALGTARRQPVAGEDVRRLVARSPRRNLDAHMPIKSHSRR